MRGGLTVYRKTYQFLNPGVVGKSNIRQKAKSIKNVTVGYLGKGYVFGDVDVVQKRNYMYTLKVARAGSALFKLKKSVYLEFFG